MHRLKPARRLKPAPLCKTVVVPLLLASALSADSNIFTTVVCAATEQHSRNTEGDVVRLRDGSLLLAYSEYIGSNSSDFANARISAKTSRDGGHTWSEPFVLMANTGKMNVTSPSLLRLRSGKLALAYAIKNSTADNRVFFRVSGDEGKTWSEPVRITRSERYWGINNARLIQLRSGRLLAPLWGVDDWNKSHHTMATVFTSDDEGRTWQEGQTVDIPAGHRGADEPGVVELRDGRVLMIIRSDLGKIYRAYSSDRGAHWTAAEPTSLDSPTAPATIARIPSTGDLLLVWNHHPPGATHMQDRFPLTAAISRDDGTSWEQIRNLDETPGYTFAYTSITFVKPDQALLTYYAANELPGDKQRRQIPGEQAERRMFSLKLKLVPIAWFYGK
ncbi:MAG TPA: sialidase family protein [Bryobacteraceae bacterium]|nr:sialidase family protein [Bryobacteraceae bacterium]